MSRPDKPLDARVKEAKTKGSTTYHQRGLVVKHSLPDDLPEGFQLRVKGRPVRPTRYKITGKSVKWDPPISIYTPVQAYSPDGATKLWEWTAFNGDAP